MRFTTTLQQPFAVQDVECAVVGFDPDDKDYETRTVADAQHCRGEHRCKHIPPAIYVKMDNATTTSCLQHLASNIAQQVTTLLA